MLPSHTHSYDVLVIGAGGAGLMASLECASQGLSVACISKVPPTRSHTVAAKGGINAALGNINEDHWHWHMYDTVRGSDFLADQDAVALLCSQAKRAVLSLESYGIPFSRHENGKIDQRIYGGQSTHLGKGDHAHRACYVADRTGHAILQTLYQQCLRHKTQFFVDFIVIDLVYENGQCHGVMALELDTGELHYFQAKITLIATGGHGQIYSTTTSSSICTGDGTAMVARLGLPLKDMEFVQFHPTGLHRSGLLITEAARAEGAILLNGKGERFMEHYAPRYKELAARDVIARAIAKEIAEGRGAGEAKDHVWLDLRHLPKATLAQKLPEVCELAKNFAKCDPAKELIPIAPSVHYMMGGIPTNVNCEVIDRHNQPLIGLMAVGEAACVSVHGANRLGCNALLDLIVFAKIAAKQAHTRIKAQEIPHKHASKSAQQRAVERLTSLVCEEKTNPSVTAKRQELQLVMDQHFGVYRTCEAMEQGLAQVISLYEKRMDIAAGDASRIWNTELVEALEYQNLVTLAYITAQAACARTESRGSHFRADYPLRDDKNWFCHSLVEIENDTAQNHTLPIRMEQLDKHQPLFMPEDRVY
jgi:succinate dehydrogenase / fumarate reductase flavoprotein subunit